MNNIKKKIIAFVAVTMSGVLAASSIEVYNQTKALAAINKTPVVVQARTTKYDDEIRQAEAEKKKYEEQAAEKRRQIDSLNYEYNEILEYVERLDKQMNELSADLYEVNVTIAELEGKILATENELAEAKKVRDNQYEKMKARIKYVYENGESSVLDILLSSGNLADLLNRVEYVSQIAKYDDTMFEQFKKSAQNYMDLKDKYTAEKDSFEAVKASYQTSIDLVEELAAKKNEAMEECAKKIGVTKDLYLEIMNDIESKEKTIEEAKKKQADEIAAAEAEERRQQELLKQQAAAGTANSTAQSTGVSSVSGITQTDNSLLKDMIWPLPGYSRISSSFGPRKSPTSGASSNHKGTDIPAPTGTKVVAALAGTVVAATYSSSAGNYVMIDHGNGIRTVYMHSSKLLVSTGQYVKQGQVIMLVGSTGASTGPHLHFGLSIDGTYVNAMNYVAY